jgi:uncharacterized membrane protein YraQ (UPF0718 family)
MTYLAYADLSGHSLRFVVESWSVVEEMAPYLLLGFLMAGVLSVIVSQEFVERHLGRRGLWQVIKAALLGVPLPLCSCGVIPVAVSLHRHGAGKGATLSFLASTPQTGLDSIMVTHALLGPVFVVFRIVTAFVSGIAAGVVVELRGGRADGADGATPAPRCACCHGPQPHGRVRRALAYGFLTLPREIGRAMLLGILISGLLSAVVPENFFADRLGTGLGAMLLLMLAGIPMYVCSAGSVPIALALIRMGISPGAALVFLVTGPATNAATIATVWKVLGRWSAGVYLATIAVSALAAGLVMDALVTPTAVQAAAHVHAGHATPAKSIMAVILLVMLAPSLIPRRGAHAHATEEPNPSEHEAHS